MAVSDGDNTPLPGTVFSPRQIRALKFAVIIMGVLLVGGFAFVLAAIVYQASRLGTEDTVSGAGAEKGTLPIDLPVGENATVTAMSLDGDRLALHLTSGAGPEIVVIDLDSGKLVARVRLSPR